MNSPITSIKVRFPKKSQRVRKRYKAVKGKELKINKRLKITEKTLIAAGISRENSYQVTELTELLCNGGSVRSLVIKLPKTYVVKEYSIGDRRIKRKIACYSGEDIYNLVVLRDAGELPRKKYANYNDNTNKLPATLYTRPKRKNRRVKKVVCEHCGCTIPKGQRKPKKLSYTEMLRTSGKFSGILKVRSNIISGRRSYVRDKE